MASINTEVSAHSLIHLVYQYLKENGHEEAASVLRKHTPQVEVPNVDVSLNDIFKKWRRGKQKKKKDKSTQKTCAKEHSKGSAKLHSKSSNKEKVKDTSKVGPLSSKKKTKTKTNAKNSSSVESQTTANSNTKETCDQDSDSDSSLDVEKWKKLALKFSDVDIAKMDVFTNLSTSVGTAGGKSKKKVSKKDGTLIKGKSKSIKPQTKSTTTTVLSEGEDTVLPSKVKVKEKNSTDPNSVETPSRNTADNAHCTEPRFKTPESKVGIKSTGSPKLNIANGISQTGSGKDSEFISGSMGENAEPEKTQEITQSKKSKSKKAIKCTEPIAPKPEIIVENSQSVPDSVVEKSPPKKNKSKHAKITNSVDIITQAVPDVSNFSNSEPAKTPNKKVKSKKSSKHAQPENDSSQETCMTATEDSGTTVVTSCKQVKNKKSAKQKDLAMLSEESGTTAVSEQPQTPSKQTKNLKTTVLTSPSFKENTSFEEVIDTPLKTPSKKSKTKKSSNTDEDETVSTADCENVQDSAPKKRKRRKSEYSEENMHLPVTESELNRSKVDNDHDVCVRDGMKNENEDNNASVVEDDASAPKRKKKHKKDKLKKEEIDEPKVEEIPPSPPPPPPEEMADSLLSSKKKKKKKKKNHGEEETSNDAAVVPEEEPPKKKKKKSSKELEHPTETAE